MTMFCFNDADIDLIASIIDGEWSLDNIGRYAVADCMASRIRLWGHTVKDITREFYGRDETPSIEARDLAVQVLDGRIKGSGYLYCFSATDVNEILPKRGYNPLPADLSVDWGNSGKLGLRLYRDEKWKGPKEK